MYQFAYSPWVQAWHLAVLHVHGFDSVGVSACLGCPRSAKGWTWRSVMSRQGLSCSLRKLALLMCVDITGHLRMPASL